MTCSGGYRMEPTIHNADPGIAAPCGLVACSRSDASDSDQSGGEEEPGKAGCSPPKRKDESLTMVDFKAISTSPASIDDYLPNMEAQECWLQPSGPRGGTMQTCITGKDNVAAQWSAIKEDGGLRGLTVSTAVAVPGKNPEYTFDMLASVHQRRSCRKVSSEQPNIRKAEHR